MFNRHDLLYITRLGREQMAAGIEENCRGKFSSAVIREMKELVINGYKERKIPVIVRRNEMMREENREGKIAIGLSSPYYKEAERLRIPGYVSVEQIKSVITPFDILRHNEIPQYNSAALHALRILKNFTDDLNINLGVWGSVALEIVTGLSYINEQSDLDIIIEKISILQLLQVLGMIEEIERSSSLCIDLEVRLIDGMDVKGKEMFLEQEEILAKDSFKVTCLNRKRVIETLY